jgi:uncharacterized SAM-binding protein YcdF (DUF218 family)
MSFARRTTFWVLAILAVICAYVALTTFEVWRVGRRSGIESVSPADAIVVMGAAQYDGRPSPQLAARLDHAVHLWTAGKAPLIVVTGGKQPGDRFTEADASRDYLVDRGVPATDILEENASHSTWEALHNVRLLLDESRPTVTRLLIVSDPFHSLRSRLIAEENGFDASTSSTPSSPVVGTKALEKHLKEGCGVALGRIIGFKRLWKITG